MDPTLNFVVREVKKNDNILKFTPTTFTNLNSVNSSTTFKRKKRMNVVNENLKTTKITAKKNKVKLKKIIMCVIFLVAINLIVIICN